MTFVDTNVFMYAVGRPHPHGHQRLVAAGLEDSAVLKEDDLVGPRDGGQAVRDIDHKKLRREQGASDRVRFLADYL